MRNSRRREKGLGLGFGGFGAGVLIGGSGTACRAPTEEMASVSWWVEALTWLALT